MLHQNWYRTSVYFELAVSASYIWLQIPRPYLDCLFKTLAGLETAKKCPINVFHCKKESLWFPFKMLQSAVSDIFWTNTTWDQSSGPPRTSQVDPKSETDEEKEEGSADNLPQLLPPAQKNEEIEDGTSHKKWGKRRGDLTPPLHLDVLEHDEAEEKAGDSSTNVCNHAVAGINVVVTPIGGIAEVESKEANDWSYLQHPRQLSPHSKRRLVFPKPIGCKIKAVREKRITLSWRWQRLRSSSSHRWRNWLLSGCRGL